MAYQKPFTPQQRREAIMAYHSYRMHLRRLRRKYPPMTNEQGRLLVDYAEVIKEIADELRKPDRSVDVRALTRSDAGARWLAMEYFRLKSAEQ